MGHVSAKRGRETHNPRILRGDPGDVWIELRPRNWSALLGLWTALATWLILVGTGVAIGSGAASEDIFSVLGWVALGFGTAALILSVAGIAMIRTHGETVVAILALVLTLSLTSYATPLLYGFGGGF